MIKVVRRGLHTYGYLLIIATIITVFAALTTIGVSAEVTFDKSYYKYNGEEGVKIIGFNGLNDGETVTIPAELDGKPVLAIGLEGVVTTTNVPGAEHIGKLDLTQATNLKVILPHAFSTCYNIKGTIESVTVEKIGECAFGFCAQITNINFPACMTVETGAFGITGLKPKQVTLAEGCSIGKGAFEFTKINDLINDINYVNLYFDISPYEYDINHDGNISEDEKGVTIIGFNPEAFDESGKVIVPAQIVGKPVLALGRSDLKNHISGAEKIGALDLTQTGVKVIEDKAFCDFKNLKGTIESDTVEKVGIKALAFCKNLENVSLPKCTSIGEFAFESCKNLINIDLPVATSIDPYAFRRCDSLTSVYLPECISVYKYAFEFCTQLENITLQENCQIGHNAFAGVPGKDNIIWVKPPKEDETLVGK